MALNPQTVKPVKLYMGKITAIFDDGTVVDAIIPASQRSNLIGILNQIAPFITAPTGQNVHKIEILVGNGKDTA